MLGLQVFIGVASVFAGLFLGDYMVSSLRLPAESLWILLAVFISTIIALHARKGWYGLTIGALIGVALVPLIGIVGLLVICGGLLK